MLTGIHILMTYKCNLECDHCFIYSSPNAQGTMTLSQIRAVLVESRKISSVEWIYFEGGEPFLFYPSLLEGIRLARAIGFKVGIVTNAYGAISAEDAEAWLQPLADLGVAYLSISDDAFHYGSKDASPARCALDAAQKLGLHCGSISIEQPSLEEGAGDGQSRGKPVIAGGAVLRGRAVDKLVAGLPRRPWQDFTECPHEDLADPARVHLDSYGNVHLCQGLSTGNMWQVRLSQMFRDYASERHPICGPLLRGGPARLVAEYDLKHEDEYVDACHLCYLARRTLLDRFPQYLAPRQVYGLE